MGLYLTENDPVWYLDEASFEMMGFLMARNSYRLLGLYDKFSTFFSQVNVYCGKGLCESHDLATLLSLYNAKSWNLDTGEQPIISQYHFRVFNFKMLYIHTVSCIKLRALHKWL